MSKKPSVVIALGGNALIQRGQKGTADDQFNNLKAPMKAVVDLCKEYNVVITHGNGPQVGNIMLQQAATTEVPEMPMAETAPGSSPRLRMAVRRPVCTSSI